MKKFIMSFVLNDVKRYFGFLLERGYRISNAEYFRTMNGNWAVDLASSKCNIRIGSDRSVLFLVFIPLTVEIKYATSIGAMIYFLSRDQSFIGDLPGHWTTWRKREQFERLSGILKTYIDQAEPYFGEEFEKYKDDILAAQERYNKRLRFERGLMREGKNR